MSITVKKFVTGPIETNTYLLSNDTSDALVIDPSSGCESIIGVIESEHLKLIGILLTHGHFDHLLGIPELLAKYPGVPVYTTEIEKELLTNSSYNGSSFFGEAFAYKGPVQIVKEGEAVIGAFTFKILVIPGHSPEGCAYLIDKFCFCGDILFADSIGRSDLPGGDGDLLLKGIKEKLMILPEETVVCPAMVAVPVSAGKNVQTLSLIDR